MLFLPSQWQPVGHPRSQSRISTWGGGAQRQSLWNTVPLASECILQKETGRLSPPAAAHPRLPSCRSPVLVNFLAFLISRHDFLQALDAPVPVSCFRPVAPNVIVICHLKPHQLLELTSSHCHQGPSGCVSWSPVPCPRHTGGHSGDGVLPDKTTVMQVNRSGMPLSCQAWCREEEEASQDTLGKALNAIISPA